MRVVIRIGLVVLLSAASASAQQLLASDGTLHLLDAVQAALSRQPGLQIQEQQYEISRSLLQQAGAPFNKVLGLSLNRTHTNSPVPGLELSQFLLASSDSSEVGATYQQLLRNGIKLNGSLGLDRAIAPGGLTTSRLFVEAGVPLMRGRGRDVTTAEQRAAELGRDGSQFDYRHATAALIAQVVTSYWRLAAAQRSLTVAGVSMDRGAQLLENTRALITAGLLPGADGIPVEANLADREATQISAHELSVEAHQQLMLDMGVPLDAVSIDVHLDEFPGAGRLPSVLDLPGDVQPFVEAALTRRADYLAAQARMRATRVQNDAAKNGVLPQFDLNLQFGTTAFTQGEAFGNYFSGLLSHLGGPNFVGRFTYQFPLQNSLAIGRLGQTDAERRQAELRSNDLARSIRSSIITAYNSLRSAVRVLELAHRSTQAFQRALDGERAKLSLGTTSIVEVLSIEDRLTSAEGHEVSAWQTYAQALVQFSFATGSLVPPDGPLPPLDERVWTTVPSSPTASNR